MPKIKNENIEMSNNKLPPNLKNNLFFMDLCITKRYTKLNRAPRDCKNKTEI